MTYQPEAFEVLAERAFKAIQDAHNSGYILGNENAEARIIKLLEGYQGLTGMFVLERDDLIALIKGEQKSQSEHLTDAIQTTVWAYEEGEQK